MVQGYHLKVVSFMNIYFEVFLMLYNYFRDVYYAFVLKEEGVALIDAVGFDLFEVAFGCS